MKNVELLLKLQESYNKMDESYKIFNDKSYIRLLSSMKKEFDKLKIDYMRNKNQLEDTNRRYNLINKDMESIKNEIKEGEYKLYNECGSDLKMINTLEKELENKNNKLKDMEKESLNLLEKEEELEKREKELKTVLTKIKNEFNDYKRKMNNIMEEAKKEFEIYKEEIEKIRNEISPDILEEFDYIKTQKKIAVSALEKDVCTGCKVKVSSMTLSGLKRGEDIVHCDNCGRILCLISKKNE
ncbi:hypothetical protein BD780_002771 [Clostridium tetanomorphum]|uniref:C4-type zinc ribbon domain-containing protein n=1 Tax=Clostridium tetanomorphum TaxID=1553 RepID=A0A923E6P7_CLOTT|nr:C4-type zinc ribbon domain-containing protein [Clostridium tetanomorphum]KAJ53878.1 hypothetical protein CTM_01385 [Clostridium tetanomorphum DSM 665]MBC2397393.1 hypothetical protein [Clostridium tetanomorphum]MBP1862613.1 putative nucleic acid-binding Zn-ribbon protein [Clostridium tetanomorphum]NRS85546.1 hypothetical protein [Clostridium tetanomorphum]NRZ96443.1 hypothetical protein [Clostridium tetanomorphum]